MRPHRFSFLFWLKRIFPLSRQARIAATVVPIGLRYRFALAMSRWQGRVMTWVGRNGRLTEALMREHWIGELTVHGPFPIPWRVHGREVLDRYSLSGPVLYYATHVPLSTITLRVLIELGYPTPFAIADRGRIVEDGYFPIFGMAQRVPALAADGYSLIRMRTALRCGHPVACLMDRELGGEQFANPLRLAARLRVPVIFMWAEMGPGNVIDVMFSLAPHPMCETEEAIAANTKALQEINDRILGRISVEGAGAEESAKSDTTALNRPKDQAVDSEQGGVEASADYVPAYQPLNRKIGCHRQN